VGLVVSSLEKVGEAVTELLRPDCYHRLKANAATLRNNAVYDAVHWLERIIEGHAEEYCAGQTQAGLPHANFNSGLTLA
jgi:hypothetical protein